MISLIIIGRRNFRRDQSLAMAVPMMHRRGELRRPAAKTMPMPVHAICPSLQCQKILELPEDARGREVNCRYCGMHFRVPRIRRRPIEINPQPIEAQPEPGVSPQRQVHDQREVIYVGG